MVEWEESKGGMLKVLAVEQTVIVMTFWYVFGTDLTFLNFLNFIFTWD